jgi:site-specific recombinase XerD
MLRKWISKPYGYIFLPEKCESMNEEEIRRYLKTMLVNYDRALKKPGEFFDIPNLSSHYLRHLFANHMRMNKVDIGVVKTMMRHKKFETTEGYITATAEDIADESLLGLEE